MSAKGNLEVHCGRKIVWSRGNNTADYLYFHNNGNLVLYNKNNNPIWKASDIWNRMSTPDTLVMQNDGNLVLYDKCGKPYWESKTYDKCKEDPGLMAFAFLTFFKHF